MNIKPRTNIGSSLWARYFKELTGTSALEYEYGFVSYKALDNGVFHIEHVYIAPQHRSSGKLMEMLEDVKVVAIDLKCSVLMTSVDLSTRTCGQSLGMQLNIGFIPYLAKDGMIWLRMELKVGGG